MVADRVTEEVGGSAKIVDLGAGHGDVSLALAGRGHEVVAIEPVARMREKGARRTGPEVAWVDATGEDTGLEAASVDAIASNFGAFLCDPEAGCAEWARILRPGGMLVMTAWDEHGFLAEMTRRMMAVLFPDGGGPQHMRWGDDNFVRTALTPHFSTVQISHELLTWQFTDVADGMRLYLEGSPTHAFSLAMAGEARPVLEATLQRHLAETAGPDGSIDSVAGYSLITARKAGSDGGM
jgi:ubiquinone/menaquinone biosynthesis C-methylase UbiE